MTRDEIVEFIDEILPDDEIVLFDGLEDAFLGVATRFEPVAERVVHADGGMTTRTTGGVHRYFAVYDYDKIIEGLVADGMDWSDAQEHFEFNIEGAYVGETTPAILYRKERP